MKNLKKIFLKLSVFVFVLISFFNLNANKNFAANFYLQDTKVILKENGSAEFITLMDYRPTNGTEYYIPMSNLGLSKILNFKVSEIIDGKEVDYENKENWNINASILEKKYKYGIVSKKDGCELCFGIGDYSRKTFILRYTVTDFAKLLNDSDMIFWKFINDNLDTPPDLVKITISKENGEFNEQNSKIWAFGTRGNINFEDGKIKFISSGVFSRNNYVTVLSKIDKGYFKSGEKIPKNFSDYKDRAFKGSSYDNQKNYSKQKSSVFKFIFKLIFYFLPLGILSKYFLKKSHRFKGGYKKGDFKGEYYRDIPEKEWWKLSLILESAKFDGYKSVIRAYFLKWIQEKLLIPITEEEGFIFKKDVVSLKINSELEYKFVDNTEKVLFDMLKIASGNDMILQKKEFKKYLDNQDNQDDFEDLIDELNSLSKTYLSEKNYLEINSKGNVTLNYNGDGKKFTENLVKYYNYLKDFTLLSERELKEIKVWKELLIYATLFDVSETVENQLKNLSPEFIEQQDIDVYDLHRAMIYSQVFSSSFISAYDTNVRNSSSGGGGFSSITGGGGSFGGSSGGGSR